MSGIPEWLVLVAAVAVIVLAAVLEAKLEAHRDENCRERGGHTECSYGTLVVGTSSGSVRECRCEGATR